MREGQAGDPGGPVHISHAEKAGSGWTGPGRGEVGSGQPGLLSRQTAPVQQLPWLAAKIDDTQAQVAELP